LNERCVEAGCLPQAQVALLLMLCLAGAASGATSPAGIPAAARAVGLLEDEARPGTAEPAWEGAIGLVVHHGAAYLGSARRDTGAHPGGFLRWGRYTITGAGGFTTRRNVDIERGFGAELLRTDGLRVRLHLRHDGGRSQEQSPELAGMGDIRPTVRARLSLRWEPMPGWVLSGAGTADLLGRVGGYGLDAGVSRQWEFGHGRRLAVSAGLGGAGGGYMQAWHGVTPQQSARSGYPVYRAEDGLRSVHASASYRHEFGREWSSFIETSASRVVGPAARSPLTRRAGSQGLAAGLAWRF
jgi:outer membrane protein